MLVNLFDRFPKWLGTLFLIPFFYLVGWIITLPLLILGIEISAYNISLLGTLISFLLFIFYLPTWISLRWKEKSPWIALGINSSSFKLGRKYFQNGLTWAIALMSILVAFISFTSADKWRFDLDLSMILNAIFIFITIGFAEEIIFRGWLWGELQQSFSYKTSFYLQALIFSLAHIRFDYDFLHLCTLLFGLFLLGLLLGLRRILDNGSILGSIGLHGGLVGIWFIFEKGFIEFSPDSSPLIVGPGLYSPNPIGSLLSIFIMLLVLFNYRREFVRYLRVSDDTVNDSSRGANP